MNTRLTLDLGNPVLIRQLRLAAAHRGVSLKEVVVEALTSYFDEQAEEKSLLNMANLSFAEWNNPKDAEYDRL